MGGLSSADQAQVKAALNLPASQALPASMATVVAALKPIVVDYAALKIVGPGVAQTTATTRDGRHWLLTFAYDNRWYLAEADPQ